MDLVFKIKTTDIILFYHEYMLYLNKLVLITYFKAILLKFLLDTIMFVLCIIFKSIISFKKMKEKF